MFPVSVKGVLLIERRVVLLRNERQEWELPGGRLEPGEDPADCLRRELQEELSVDARVEAILDAWNYPVLPGREVVIITYGCTTESSSLRLSEEHKALELFGIEAIDGLAMPDGYRRSIRAWWNRTGGARF